MVHWKSSVVLGLHKTLQKHWIVTLIALARRAAKSKFGHLLPVLLLISITLMVYAGVLSHDFILNWDDEDYVLANHTVRGITQNNLKEAFTQSYVGNYAPIQIISYMFDHLIWGLEPTGFHLSNLLIHILNGVLFYLLLIRCRLSKLAATSAALVFLLHPVQVESVAWISQRKNVLSMQFFLLAFHAYVVYRDRMNSGRKYYYISIVLFLCSLLSKSVSVVFPLIILLYDHCYCVESVKRLILWDKIPYAALSLATVNVTIISHLVEMDGVVMGYPGQDLLSTSYTMMTVFAAYVKDCVFPDNLSPFYIIQIKLFPDLEVALSAATLLLLGIIGTILYRKSRAFFFWFVLFFVCLLPVAQLVPLVTLKNDRYLYFPMLGFAACAGGILSMLQLFSGGIKQHAVNLTIVILIFALPVLTIRQSAVWKDDLTLWNHAIEKDSDNQVGWLMLAKGHTRRGNNAAAMEAFNKLHELRTKDGPLRGWERL